MNGHVHDVALRTRIGGDGQRVYEAVGPCLSCGEPIEMAPVTETTITVTRWQRGRMNPDGTWDVWDD